MFLRSRYHQHQLWPRKLPPDPDPRPSTGRLDCLAFCPIPADAFDNDLMHRTLKNIVEGKTVEVPTYDFVTHSR